MLEKNLDIIYNKPYLVVVPSSAKELLEGFAYSFGNTILLEDTQKDCERTLNFITKNNFGKIVFVNYHQNYEGILYHIKKTHKLEFIYTGNVGNLSNENEYATFKNIIQLSKRYSNSKFAVLDKGLYAVLKKSCPKVKQIILDVELSKKTKTSYDENVIGFLNESGKPTHSFYNELSALSLSSTLIAKVLKINNITKRFLKEFNIKFQKVKNYTELISQNLVNLYINFTDSNDLTILKSLDQGVPCLVGNTNLFKDNKYLQESLVLKSDDDVNEIYEKINLIKKNRQKILSEYKKFRPEYSKKSRMSIEAFININKHKESKKDYEKLLSVIFPVYNTEKYVEKSLKSVIDARIDNMEIIVINDGSPDNSEEIILKLANKYPNLIRYIKQENHGLGNVRNVGLKEAKGKYITGVDSDDTINKHYYKNTLKYMKQDIDVIMCDWLTVTDSFKCQTPAIDPVHHNKNLYKGLLYTTIMPTSCNKIIRKEFFDELKLTYIEDKYEDLSTNPFILLRAETIKYINKPYYEYYINSNSIMRSKPGTSMINIIKEVNKRIEKYKVYINVNIDEFKFYTYTWRIEEFIIDPLYEIEENEALHSIQLINKDIKDIYLNIINTSYYKDLLSKFPNKSKIKYITERNKYLKSGQLKEFVLTKRNKNKYQKFTTYEVVYGKEEKND